jgi:hypothetical protein
MYMVRYYTLQDRCGMFANRDITLDRAGLTDARTRSVYLARHNPSDREGYTKKGFCYGG